MSLNRNATYDQDLAEQQGFQAYLTLPLTNENIQPPDEFKEALRAALAAMPAKDLPLPGDPKLLHLIQVVQANSQAFSQHVDPKVLQERVTAQLGRLITNPKEGNHFITKFQGHKNPEDETQINSCTAQNSNGKAPLYLGLDCEATKELKKDCGQKLLKLITDAWNVMEEAFGS